MLNASEKVSEKIVVWLHSVQPENARILAENERCNKAQSFQSHRNVVLWKCKLPEVNTSKCIEAAILI